MHRGRSLLLSALASAPALLVAMRAAWLCSGMLALLFCPLVGTPDRRASSGRGGTALASLALLDQVIDCPSGTRIPFAAAQTNELRQVASRWRQPRDWAPSAHLPPCLPRSS